VNRSRALVLLSCLLAGQRLGVAAQDFPYKAYINRADVYVRSGPGEEYYPTDKLAIGAEVEIYRHDPGGWYAIRPTDGSYTWVASRYLDPQKNRLATVNAERVAARVGSRFSDVRDVIQVRLQKGEVVEILDTVTAADERGGKSAWCKIAPPSGEFRWVYGKYVDPEYPRDGVRRPHSAEAPPPARPAANEPEDRPSPRSTVRSVSDRSTSGGATNNEVRRAPNAGELAAAARRRNAAPPVIEPPVAAEADPVVTHTPVMRNLSPEEYQAALEDIDLKLSVMLAEETSAWYFDDLKPQATTLLDQAQTAVERGRARLLVNKIARFDEIKRRYDAVNGVRQQVNQQNAALADLSRARGESIPTPTVEDRFDGLGRLARVAPSAAGGPSYALLDRTGQVRCYVSPAPGVNLQHYVGHEVGINGVRGNMPEQRANHVMAKHVTVIDEGTRLR